MVRLAAFGALLVACGKAPPNDAPPPASAAPPPAVTVPPAAAVSAFAPAPDEVPERGSESAFEKSRIHAANGELWLARLAIEKRALGSSGERREIELLARICHDQADAACVAECERRLGRKLVFDAGVARPSGPTADPREPTTDFTRARDLVLRDQPAEARKLLEPRVLDGRATAEETRLLHQICKQQNDRMCVALCDAKTKAP